VNNALSGLKRLVLGGQHQWGPEPIFADGNHVRRQQMYERFTSRTYSEADETMEKQWQTRELGNMANHIRETSPSKRRTRTMKPIQADRSAIENAQRAMCHDFAVSVRQFACKDRRKGSSDGLDLLR